MGEEGWRIGGEALAGDKDGSGFQVRASVEEGLRNENCCRAAVGGRTALKFGKRIVDHWRGEDLVEGIGSLELRVWIPLRVFVVDMGDFGKVGCGCTVSVDEG